MVSNAKIFRLVLLLFRIFCTEKCVQSLRFVRTKVNYKFRDETVII